MTDGARIRITKDHQTEDGFLFWEGDTFSALAGNPPFDGVDGEPPGTEVKAAGEYVWIPREIFEVLPSPSSTERTP